MLFRLFDLEIATNRLSTSQFSTFDSGRRWLKGCVSPMLLRERPRRRRVIL